MDKRRELDTTININSDKSDDDLYNEFEEI